MPRATPTPRRTTTTAPTPSRQRAIRPSSIIDAMNHPEFFGPFFNGASWDGWKTILKAANGLPLNAEELEFFHSIAGDRAPPIGRVREIWVGAGRRAGKDAMASGVAALAAALFNQQHKLRPGERALVLCLACDRAQAKIILNYIKAFFTDIPSLAAMVQGEMTAEGFSLNNSVDIAVGTNSFRAVRGRPLLLGILDELAFWRDENSSKPDVDLYRALSPALATLMPDSQIIGISSPYKKSGLLYKKFKDHYGQDGDVLFVKAATRQLNPTIPQEIVDRALLDDPAAASAEWMGEFRDDIGSWLGLEVIEAAVATGVSVRPHCAAFDYRAFCDPSGGRNDSFTCAIAHDDMGTAFLDCLVEIKPPFSPMSAITQISAVLREYGLSEVTGDRYAAEFNVEMFASCSIRYRASHRDRSAIYQDAGPLFTSGRASILDDRRLVSQFASLERKTTSMGRDKIDHGVGGHDDLANSAAGALVSVSAKDRRPTLMFG